MIITGSDDELCIDPEFIGPLRAPMHAGSILTEDLYDRNLTPAKRRRARRYHAGKWYCPQCDLVCGVGTKREICKNDPCKTKLHFICVYCDRAYAHSSRTAHTSSCKKRFFDGLPSGTGDPAEMADFHSPELDDFLNWG